MAAVCFSETLVSTYEIIHSVTTKKNNIVIFKYVLTASFDILPSSVIAVSSTVMKSEVAAEQISVRVFLFAWTSHYCIKAPCSSIAGTTSRHLITTSAVNWCSAGRQFHTSDTTSRLGSVPWWIMAKHSINKCNGAVDKTNGAVASVNSHPNSSISSIRAFEYAHRLKLGFREPYVFLYHNLNGSWYLPG